eukprot:scaffold228505_cov33-Tisochrysis_lutea.AAC.5
MLSAVLYCHQHGVVHRDIKLDNFIYEHEVHAPSRNAHIQALVYAFATVHAFAPGVRLDADQEGAIYFVPALLCCFEQRAFMRHPSRHLFRCRQPCAPLHERRVRTPS